jgi:hypothetical protein
MEKYTDQSQPEIPQKSHPEIPKIPKESQSKGLALNLTPQDMISFKPRALEHQPIQPTYNPRQHSPDEKFIPRAATHQFHNGNAQTPPDFDQRKDEHSINCTESTDNSARAEYDLEDSCNNMALRNYQGKYDNVRLENRFGGGIKKIIDLLPEGKGPEFTKEDMNKETTWDIKAWENDQPNLIFESGDFTPYDSVLE